MSIATHDNSNNHNKMETPSKETRHFPALIASAYAFTLLIIYLNCVSSSGFTIDDDYLITIPQLKAKLSLSLLTTLFTPGTHIDYYPVRDLAYWIQIHVFQADPLCLNMTVYHFSSLGLFFGILLFMSRILERRVRSRLALGFMTAIFAFLPFHSEMLMWASAQKDLLAILFGLMALDQIDLWARSQDKTHTPRWIAATGFFLLSFMSKASLVLLPPVLFIAFWLNLSNLNASKRRVALTYSAVMTGIAVAWSILQSRIYEDVNDMRFFYPFAYRLQASMAALGREVIGIFNPNVNIVDVENWGSWLRYNWHFVPVGFFVLAIAIGALIYALIKKNKTLFISILALGALYLPTSGLIFQHRNFYSTRYLEPALVCAYIFLCCAISKARIARDLSRYGRHATVAAVVVTIALLASTSKEAEAWSSSRSVIEKSLSRYPDRLSLKAYLLTTLRQENQWGRLTSSEVAQLRALENEISRRCGLLLDSRQPDAQEDRDDCMWSWTEATLNPKNRGTDRFQRAQSYLQAARARLLPEKIKQLEVRSEILEAAYGLRSQLSVEPEALIKLSGWGVLPQGRARIIAALCLTGHVPDATLLYENYSAEHLINREAINEAFNNVSKANWEAFKTLQSCFDVSRRARSD